MLTSLITAIRENNLELVKEIIAAYPVELNKTEKINGTISVEELRKRLLNLQRYEDDNNTLLHHAAINNSISVVDYLVTLDGINANLPNNSNETPLIIAVKNKQIEVVKSLFTITDLNVNLRDNDGKTALLKAASDGSIELYNLLFTHPTTEIQLRDKNGKNSLDYLSDKKELDKLSNDSINRIKKTYSDFDLGVPESWMRSSKEQSRKLIALFHVPESFSDAMGPSSMLIDYNYKPLGDLISTAFKTESLQG